MPPLDDPILIETKHFILHPFRAEEIKRMDSLSREIHHLFSKDRTHSFLKHKQLNDVHQAEALLHTALFNQFNGKTQWYLITDKSKVKTIGMIELISPNEVKQHYKLDHYPYVVEFCLSEDYMGKGIMSDVFPIFVERLKQKGIKKIGALVNAKNLKAIRVLEKSGINMQSNFDAISKLYHN